MRCTKLNVKIFYVPILAFLSYKCAVNLVNSESLYVLCGYDSGSVVGGLLTAAAFFYNHAEVCNVSVRLNCAFSVYDHLL